MGRNMGQNMAWNHLTRLTCAVVLALPLALSAAQAQDRFKVAIGQINNWENQAPTLGQDQFFKKNNLALETFGTAGRGRDHAAGDRGERRLSARVSASPV